MAACDVKLAYWNPATPPVPIYRSIVRPLYETCGAPTELDYYSKPPDVFDTLADLLEPAIQALEQILPWVDWRH